MSNPYSLEAIKNLSESELQALCKNINKVIDQQRTDERNKFSVGDRVQLRDRMGSLIEATVIKLMPKNIEISFTNQLTGRETIATASPGLLTKIESED